MQAAIYVITFLYGIVIGSFLNVCILRIPKGETIVTKRSHCMTCNRKLRWFELIPLFSYIIQGGKCRTCKTKISCQYPIIESINGFVYILILYVCGMNYKSVLYCLFFSTLLVISLIDWRFYVIPPGCNIVIFCLGILSICLESEKWLSHTIGFFAVSAFFLLIYLVTRGKGIGGGDIKLMATAGLVLGYEKIILAMVLGCIIGTIVQLLLMKLKNKDHVLAFGPYLTAGITIAMLWGDQMIEMYIKCFL